MLVEWVKQDFNAGDQGLCRVCVNVDIIFRLCCFSYFQVLGSIKLLNAQAYCVHKLWRNSRMSPFVVRSYLLHTYHVGTIFFNHNGTSWLNFQRTFHSFGVNKSLSDETKGRSLPESRIQQPGGKCLISSQNKSSLQGQPSLLPSMLIWLWKRKGGKFENQKGLDPLGSKGDLLYPAKLWVTYNDKIRSFLLSSSSSRELNQKFLNTCSASPASQSNDPEKKFETKESV